MGEFYSDVKHAAPRVSTQGDAGMAKVLPGRAGGAVHGNQQSCPLAGAHRNPRICIYHTPEAPTLNPCF